MSLLRRLWREQRVALIAFVVALGLTGLFGGRMIVRAVYWTNPAHHKQDPEPWMTPAYLARSWHLPNGAVDAAVGFDPTTYSGKRRPTLSRIARERGVSVDLLIADLRAALPRLRELPAGVDPGAPPPSGPPPSAVAVPVPEAPPPGRAP